MSRRQFRTLIAVLFLLFLAVVSLDSLFPALVPEQLRTAYDAYQDARIQPLPMKTVVHVVAYLIFALLAPILGLAGLFFFRRFGRTIFTILIAMMPLGAFLVGTGVSSWVSDLLGSGYHIGIGFALAMAWFSPLKEEFK